MLLYPQPQCIFYHPANYFVAQNGLEDASGVRYPLAPPAFFIPTL